MTYYAVGKQDGDGVLVVSLGSGALVFETRELAEDWSDQMDEEGEWFVFDINDYDIDIEDIAMVVV